MSTLFVVTFLTGLGLSGVTFLSGFHGRHIHLPKVFRHGGKTKTPAVNLAAITAFLVWFGGGGLLLERATDTAPLLGGGAIAIGSLGGALINRLLGALMRQEHTAERLTIVGTIGRLTVPIRAGNGTGELVFTHQGTRQVRAARSDCGRALDKGVEVVVTRYEKGIAYVATWAELPAVTPESQEE